MILFLLHSIEGMNEWPWPETVHSSTACSSSALAFFKTSLRPSSLPPLHAGRNEKHFKANAASGPGGWTVPLGHATYLFDNGLLFLLNVATNKTREQFKTIWRGTESLAIQFVDLHDQLHCELFFCLTADSYIHRVQTWPLGFLIMPLESLSSHGLMLSPV